MKDDRKVVDVAYDLAERLVEQGKAVVAPADKKAEAAAAPEMDSAGAKKK